jgi:drug/metabolite transporter (DMT)-like permease
LIYLLQKEPLPSVFILIQLAGSSLVCGIGFFFYIKALNKNLFSNVIALGVIGGVFQKLFANIILGESNPISFWIALALMLFGFIAQAKDRLQTKGLLWVLLSAFFWPLGYVLLSIPLKKINALWSVPIMELSIMILSLAVVFVFRGLKSIKKSGNVSQVLLFAIAILTILGSLLQNYTFQQIKISHIGIYQLSVMPITYFLSMRIFREKPTTEEFVGFIFSLSGFIVFLFL